jgi:hypothetical protein
VIVYFSSTAPISFFSTRRLWGRCSPPRRWTPAIFSVGEVSVALRRAGNRKAKATAGADARKCVTEVVQPRIPAKAGMIPNDSAKRATEPLSLRRLYDLETSIAVASSFALSRAALADHAPIVYLRSRPSILWSRKKERAPPVYIRIPKPRTLGSSSQEASAPEARQYCPQIRWSVVAVLRFFDVAEDSSSASEG